MLKHFLKLCGYGHCNSSFVCVSNWNNLKQLTQTGDWLSHSLVTYFILIQFGYKNWIWSLTLTWTVTIQSYPILTNKIKTQGLTWHHTWTSIRQRKTQIPSTSWKDNNLSLMTAVIPIQRENWCKIIGLIKENLNWFTPVIIFWWRILTYNCM